MYRFRDEAWGKKVARDHEWSTCYADLLNGYGHFHYGNPMHCRRRPDGRQQVASKAEAAWLPRVDHIWDVLNKGAWGSGSNGNARARLRQWLTEHHKQRVKNRRDLTDENDVADLGERKQQTDWRNAQILQVSKNKWKKLPPLQSISEMDASEMSSADATTDVSITKLKAVVHPRDLVAKSYPTTNPLVQQKKKPSSFIEPTTYKLHFGRGRKESMKLSHINRMIDPVTMRVAGLPTEWMRKPAHKTKVPPPYLPQPAPLPFSSRDYEDGEDEEEEEDQYPVLLVTSRDRGVQTLPRELRVVAKGTRPVVQARGKKTRTTQHRRPAPTVSNSLPELSTTTKDEPDIAWLLGNKRDKRLLQRLIRPAWKPVAAR